MEIAYLYVRMFFSIVILLAACIGCGIALVVVAAKKRKKAQKVLGIITAVCFVMVAASVMWTVSHYNHPEVNDWKFLGHNIAEIEQEYGEFCRKEVYDDNSGFAVLYTEQIVGHWMYDSNEYTCYHMEFDTNGKITKVFCERPVGG